jgi:hypothetical protein
VQQKTKQAGKIRFAGVSTQAGHEALLAWFPEENRLRCA